MSKRYRERSPLNRSSGNLTREQIVLQRRQEREAKEKAIPQHFAGADSDSGDDFGAVSYNPSANKKSKQEIKEENEKFDKILKGQIETKHDKYKRERDVKKEDDGWDDHVKKEDLEDKDFKTERKHDPKNNKKEPKQKANLGLSGALTADTNTYKGVVIKYSEPDDAKLPKKRWRIYPFKGDEALPPLHIHRQSAFLIGKHRGIVDIAIDHPSCSRQHAALQYRKVNYTRPDGSSGTTVKPYLIDLESANKTFINGKTLDPRRYYELKEKDVIKFGMSSRDYVILLDNSADGVDELKDVGDDGKTGEDLIGEFLDSQIKKRLHRKV